MSECGVAGDEARAQSGHVGALRQRREHQQVAEIGAPEPARGLQRAQRRLRPPGAKIDLGVALVAGDRRSRAYRSARTACAIRPAASPRRWDCPASRRTSAACGPRSPRRSRPSRSRNCAPGRCWRRPSRRPPAGPRPRRSGRTDWGTARSARGAPGRAAPCRIDHHLGEGEQRLARAVHRQQLRGRIQRHVVAPPAPRRPSPRAGAASPSVDGYTARPLEVAGEGVLHELGRRMARLAQPQADGAVRRRRDDVPGRGAASVRTGRGAACRATGSCRRLSRLHDGPGFRESSREPSAALARSGSPQWACRWPSW